MGTRTPSASSFSATAKQCFGLCGVELEGQELAADLTAETFAAALVAVHGGRAGAVPDGAAWLCGIARHKIVDTYRKAHTEDEARRQLRLEWIAVPGPDLDAIDLVAGPDLPFHEALDRLTSEEREAVVARVLLDRDYAAIAHDAGESEATIRKRVSRGLARLRKEIGVQTRWNT